METLHPPQFLSRPGRIERRGKSSTKPSIYGVPSYGRYNNYLKQFGDHEAVYINCMYIHNFGDTYIQKNKNKTRINKDWVVGGQSHRKRILKEGAKIRSRVAKHHGRDTLSMWIASLLKCIPRCKIHGPPSHRSPTAVSHLHC